MPLARLVLFQRLFLAFLLLAAVGCPASSPDDDDSADLGDDDDDSADPGDDDDDDSADPGDDDDDDSADPGDDDDDDSADPGDDDDSADPGDDDDDDSPDPGDDDDDSALGLEASGFLLVKLTATLALGPKSGSPMMPAGWLGLIEIVEQATAASVSLTIQINALHTDWLVADDQLPLLRSWEMSGHEIGLHHFGANTEDWDGYSGEPFLTPPTMGGTIAQMLSDASRISSVGVVCSASIEGGFSELYDMPDLEVDWPRGVPYSTVPAEGIELFGEPTAKVYDPDGLVSGPHEVFELEELALDLAMDEASWGEVLGDLSEAFEDRFSTPGLIGLSIDVQDWGATGPAHLGGLFDVFEAGDVPIQPVAGLLDSWGYPTCP